MNIIDVTPENVEEQTLFCIKDLKHPGFSKKRKWFENRYQEGLRLKILKDKERMVSFIEYLPAESAWRPVYAPDYMFIHCMFVYAKKDHNQGYGTMLIKACEEDTRSRNMAGITTMTSKGTWIFDNRLFLKNGYEEVDRKGRFELMSKKMKQEASDPYLLDWPAEHSKYSGWHLLYADQCPWHEKSVNDLRSTAEEYGIKLNIRKLTTSDQAKQAPSGFGVFSLINNGHLLADHCISRTRFINILKKELP